MRPGRARPCRLPLSLFFYESLASAGPSLHTGRGGRPGLLFPSQQRPQKMTPTPQEFLIFRGRLFSGQGRGETWWACVGSKGHNPGGRSDGGGCVHRHRGLLGTRLGPGPFPGRPTRPGAPDLLQGEEKELLGQQLRVQQQLRIRTAATAHIPRHRRRQETPGRLPTSLRGGSVPEVTYRAGTQACRHTGCAARPAPPFAAVRVLGWLSLGVAPSTPHRERKEGGVSRRNHWRSKSRRQKGKGEGRGAGHDWSRSSDIQWRRPKGAQGQPRGQEAGKARHYPTYGPCHISNYLGFLNVSCVLFVS